MLVANLSALRAVSPAQPDWIAAGESKPHRRAAYPLDYDPRDAALILCLGWSPWCAEAMDRLGDSGVMIVYEPDPGHLRADLEAHDRSATLRAYNLRWCRSKEDIRDAIRGLESLVMQGLKVLWHPDDSARMREPVADFLPAFDETLKAMRINVVSTLVLAEKINRNLLANLPAFVSAGGIAGLRDIRKGKPAIVVSAGPSLGRNIEQLHSARGFTLLAVQTALKPLLGRGIKPHLVCAIDYHELSGRFYEGLTASQVEGVQLATVPSVSPAVLKGWPGAVRMTGDPFYDELLDEDTEREYGTIPPTATVAHFAYHLARYMGCDPVVLVGQDLGFTDGAYYGKDAAIHQVWSSELNEFNTLEMMEHQRIARGGVTNQKVTGVDGRSLTTDVQMAAYLDIFNAMFKADAAKGLTTVDATEGGAAKQHVLTMTLREAIRKWGEPSVGEVLAERVRVRRMARVAGQI